eukprot:366391-Chlamydomonas_euryale.AAC.39
MEPKLHEAQNGFRKGRGTTDAMFTRWSSVNTVAHHQSPTAPDEGQNSPGWETLWEVLKLYGVHPHVIKFLEDLHMGTEVVVRVDGEVGRSFTVKAGVRQVCAITPTIFNVLSTIFCKRTSHSCPRQAIWRSNCYEVRQMDGG